MEKPAGNSKRPQISQKKQIKSALPFEICGRIQAGSSSSLRMTDRYVSLQSADQKLALIDHLRWQVIMQLDKQLLMADDLFTPRSSIDLLQLIELLL